MISATWSSNCLMLQFNSYLGLWKARHGKGKYVLKNSKCASIGQVPEGLDKDISWDDTWCFVFINFEIQGQP